MQKVKVITFLLILVVTNYGCESDSLSENPQTTARDVKTLGNLEFTYQVTDMEGNPKNTFSEGENLMLSFVVKNPSDNDIMVSDRWWFLTENNEFFAIYKTNNGNRELIGKSFRTGGNTYDAAGQGVPANSEIEYRIPWLTQKDTSYTMPIYIPDIDLVNKRRYRAIDPSPQPLTPGKYYSSFNFQYQDEEISFSISFEVK